MPLSVAGRPSEDEAINVIQQFVELNGNFIDTANIYGLNENDKGHNERLIHRALKQSGQLDNVLVATKGGATRPQGGWSFRGGGHPKNLRIVCEESLKNLKITEHILYYLHGPDPDVPLEESWGALIELKREGKIRHLGIANVNLDQLKMAVKLTSVVAVQNRCNPFCKGDFKNQLIDFCKEHNISYVPYCPLGGWTDHAKLAKSNLFDELTTKYRVSSYVICLAWLLNKAKHIIPIPGVVSVTQLTANFTSTTLIIEPADIAKIDNFPDFYLPQHID